MLRQSRRLLAALAAVAIVAACARAFVPSPSAVVLISDSRGGHGAGVVIAEGVILTAGHVLQRDELTVTYDSGLQSEVTATVIDFVGTQSPAPDLGLAWADTLGIEPVRVSCDQVAVGDEIWTMGNPAYLRWATSRGIVASLRPLVAAGTTYRGDYYLADITIMPGSSGGPVFGSDGRLVGIVTATVGIANSGAQFAIVQSPAGICAFLASHKVL